jgi:sugar lactone lactonase YvrE
MMAGLRAPVSLLFAAALACGCAGDSGTAAMRYGIEDAPEGKRLLWPQPPEVPRYLFSGQLTGEANFVRDGGGDSRVGSFFRWLAGVMSGDEQPVVLQRPQSGMVDESGRVLVTDVSRQAVFVFDEPAGRLQVWERADARQGFVAPSGIAAAPDGGVWVADAQLALVAHLDREGNPLQPVGKGILRRPTGVAWDAASRRLFVADAYAHEIKVFDVAGNLIETIGRRGDGPGEFNYPSHVALAGDDLYVTDTMNSRVQVISLTGGAPRIFGERGLYIGNLVRPKGVAVDSEGNIYIVESYYDHLLVFNRKGQFLMPIGGMGYATGKFYLPAGVWVDSRNRIFIADMFNGRVTVFQFLGGGAENAG